MAATPAVINATTLSDLIGLALQNPQLGISLAIQFLLGLGLGYVSAKAAKYIIAFVAILIIGTALNVWSLGMTTEDVIARLGTEFVKLKDSIMSFLQLLGILTVGPVSIGFFLGLAIAFFKK